MSNNDATAKLVEAARAVADATFSTGVAVNPDEQKRALVKLVAICDAETLPPPSPAVAIEDATNPVCDPENVPTPPAPADRARLARRVAELEKELANRNRIIGNLRREMQEYEDGAEEERETRDATIADLHAKLAAAGGWVDRDLTETARVAMAAIIAKIPLTEAYSFDKSVPEKAANGAANYARALHAALRQAGGGE